MGFFGGWSTWQKLLDMRWAEKAVEEGLERGFYGCFKRILEEVPGKSIFPGSPRERMEAGEASQSCNIPIPELCVLQRGPGVMKSVLSVASHKRKTQSRERSQKIQDCGAKGLDGKRSRCHPSPWKTGSLFAQYFFPFFPLFLFGFCLCSEQPNELMV